MCDMGCEMGKVDGLAVECDNCHNTILSVLVCFEHDVQICKQCLKHFATVEALEDDLGVVQEVEDLHAAASDPEYSGRENEAFESLTRALENFCSAKSFTSVAAWARISNMRAEVLS